MPGIVINRDKYRKKKNERDWLARFIDEQVKGSVEEVKTIGEKEIRSTKSVIIADQLFALAVANGFELAKIKISVEEGQQGAIGRARMILTGCLKRKLIKDAKLYDRDGDEIDVDAEYLASIQPAPKDESKESEAA